MDCRPYLDAIHRYLASIQAEGPAPDDDDPLARCTLHKEGGCPLVEHLPGAVQAIHALESPWMEDYLAAVHDRVFGLLETTAPDERCPLSLDTDCPLARYLVLVVRSMDEAGA